jgi:Lon protease-like protein
MMFLASRAVPVFPLPDCVVLPGGVQPLHIFEPRYREMVADELARAPADRYVAMALLKPGHEPYYYSHHAPVYPATCLCRIIRHELLPDGRSNVLIEGLARATIREECHRANYRQAKLQEIETISDLTPLEEAALRAKLAGCLQGLPQALVRVLCEIVADVHDLERVVDRIAFLLLEPAATPAKHMLLAETRLDFRVKMLVTLIERGHVVQASIPVEADPRAHYEYN